jgi:hypothetical protein
VTEPRTQRVAQFEALKLFTHPLRLRLYYALAARGSATATVLARDVGTTAQLAFYHLSKLAEYRLIEEDLLVPSRGRDRYWRRSAKGLTFASSDLGPEAANELEMLHRAQASLHFQRLQDFLDSSPRGDDEFRSTAFGSDAVITLTKSQLQDLQQELVALFQRHRQAAEAGRDAAEPTAEVFFFMHAFPLTDLTARTPQEAQHGKGTQ